MSGERSDGARDVGARYERPSVRDFGSLTELTRATGFVGPEDGGSKLVIHHSAAAQP